MGKTLYMECNAGISGDMTVAALLDLGADKLVLENVLKSIPIQGFEVKLSRVKKSGIDCMDFSVELAEGYENHDHDMKYLHGGNISGEEQHDHEHYHVHEERHDQAQPHCHEHRGIKEIFDILERTDMTDGAKKIAKRIFEILAEAEAKAHGTTVENVHFHEVGAIDSIVDITAAAVCFDNLGISEVIVPKVCEGTGTIRCAHGILPVPVPATANIMSRYHLPVEFIEIQGEFVTPTGAAILAAVMTSEHLKKGFKIQKIGNGAGKRTYERPSILRMMLIETEDVNVLEDTVYKLETNIDDCTGEALSYVMERLLAAGARDVHYLPVYMKKNRPAWQLDVLCEKKDLRKMEQIIFMETTTIGIRRVLYERTILPRSMKTVQTSYGEVQVKVCRLDGVERYYPEYESVARLSREKGISYQELYREVLKEVL